MGIVGVMWLIGVIKRDFLWKTAEHPSEEAFQC